MDIQEDLLAGHLVESLCNVQQDGTRLAPVPVVPSLDSLMMMVIIGVIIIVVFDIVIQLLCSLLL